MAKAKLNNFGLPADRREDTVRAPMGNAPTVDLSLKGSGYDKSWAKPNAKVAGAGKVSSNVGNGGRKSTVKVGKSK